MADTSTTWVGWHRRSPKALWRRVCTAPTEAECRSALNAARHFGDRLVLPEGRDPNREELASARRDAQRRQGWAYKCLYRPQKYR